MVLRKSKLSVEKNTKKTCVNGWIGVDRGSWNTHANFFQSLSKKIGGRIWTFVRKACAVCVVTYW